MPRRWLLVLLFGCSTPASRPPPPSEPKSVVLYACTLSGRWVEQPRELRMAPDHEAYAKVFGVEKGQVTFGTSVHAILETPSVVLGGYIDSHELKLYARKSLVIGGFLVPGPKFPLRYVASEHNALLTVEATPPNITAKQPLRVERPCSDLAIEEQAFDPKVAVAGAVQARVVLEPDISIPLSVEANGPPVAELRYETSPRADVLAWGEKTVNVIVRPDSLNPAENLIAFGWVPRTAILRIEVGSGGSWARGGEGSPLLPRSTKYPRVTCEHDVALSVQRGRDVRPVGHIRPNVVIELVTDGDPVQVTLPRAGVELAIDARWLVERAALAKCAATQP